VTDRDAQGDGQESRLRVVIADDEPDVRILLGLQLEQAGFDVVGESADGRQTVDVCQREAPDALVLDLLMPGMSAFDVIPRLKATQPRLGIVAYTAVAGDFVRREMARLRIPLLLKSGDVQPLAQALRASAGGR
jgi:DNA-binding NarL/FixJ family response regulator